MFWPILQLFLHRQSVKRTAESIVCWTKVKEISTSVLDAKPVTFQKHTKTIIITCLHYLQDNMRNIMKMCLFYFSLWIFESHSIKKNCPKMDFWLKYTFHSKYCSWDGLLTRSAINSSCKLQWIIMAWILYVILIFTSFKTPGNSLW